MQQFSQHLKYVAACCENKTSETDACKLHVKYDKTSVILRF